jgi:hypothetical protein
MMGLVHGPIPSAKVIDLKHWLSVRPPSMFFRIGCIYATILLLDDITLGGGASIENLPDIGGRLGATDDARVFAMGACREEGPCLFALGVAGRETGRTARHDTDEDEKK